MGHLDLSGLHAYKRNAQAIAVKAVSDTSIAIEKQAKQLAPIRGHNVNKKSLLFEGGRSANREHATTYINGRIVQARRAFRQLGRHEAGDRGSSFFYKGNFFQFEAAARLTARGRAELRRGAKDIQAGGESSVIEVPVDVTKHLREGVRKRSMTESTTLGVRGGAVVTKTKTRTYTLGRQTGFGHTYQLQLGGRLKRDIQARFPEYTDGKIEGGVDSLAPYSRYVEYPTSRTRAQPFLRPALKANRMLLKRTLKDGFRGQG